MMKQVSSILPGSRLSEAHQCRVLDDFYRDGLAMVPEVLSSGEIEALRAVTDRCLDTEPDRHVIHWAGGAAILRYTQSIQRCFCDMLVREPFLSLAEAILGPECRFVGQNVIRSARDTGISFWHVDDVLEFPLPDNIPRHDARLRLPVLWFSFQIALSDIDGVEFGPTEYVPGSHYSGRTPPVAQGEDQQMPLEFEGHGVTPVLCKAGDVYLFNHQLWHRGSVNRSERPRYLMQNQYGRAWGARRFANPDDQCTLSDADLAGASSRLLQLLGRA